MPACGLTAENVVFDRSPDGDQMENMDTVSLQAVTLADGSTAYIQHDSKASFSDGQIMDGQVIQLEDGSAAYVQHVSMPKTGSCVSGLCSSFAMKMVSAEVTLFFECSRRRQFTAGRRPGCPARRWNDGVYSHTQR